MDSGELVDRVVAAVSCAEGVEAEAVRDLRVLESHIGCLESLVSVAVELIQAAPRQLSRDSGEAGRLWDRFLDAVAELDPDLRSGAGRLTGRPGGNGGRGPVVGVADTMAEPDSLTVATAAAIAASAARVQRRVDALEDTELSEAWDFFLVALVGG